MVHNKHKMINNIKDDFTFWQGLEFVSKKVVSSEVEACKRCAIPNAFGHCQSQKRNNGLCGMMVQANYKIMKEKRTILLLGRDSSL